MIIILPFEGIDDTSVEIAENVITEVFKITPVVYKEKLKIPKRAYNPTRNQYDVSYFLLNLNNFLKDKNDKIIGVTNVDLYIPGLNFIFGAANKIGGNVCIVSTTRLREEFYKNPRNDSLFKERLKKEVVHELGHLYGLGHCKNSYCVMHFSNNIIDTDIKSYDFCKNCKHKLNKIKQ